MSAKYTDMKNDMKIKNRLKLSAKKYPKSGACDIKATNGLEIRYSPKYIISHPNILPVRRFDALSLP
jgi:hypothetical protein